MTRQAIRVWPGRIHWPFWVLAATVPVGLVLLLTARIQFGAPL